MDFQQIKDIIHIPPTEFIKRLYPAFKGPEKLLRQFGQLINNSSLTTTVLWLYNNATAESSRRTTRCGENRFKKFTLEYFGGLITPIPNTKMSLKGLLLCYFAGALFLDPKNLQFTTIRNYISHIRSNWNQSGAPLLSVDHAGLARVLKGISTARPSNPDTRKAFLLPHFHFPPFFKNPITIDQLLFKAAVIFGFFGMFRFCTFQKLSANALVLVSKLGVEYNLKCGSYDEIMQLENKFNIVGFYFNFAAKFHPHARAYYCRMEDLNEPWATLCPMTVLLALAKNNLLSQKQIFPCNKITTKNLSSYMRCIARFTKSFTPHSLRIGGHTFYSVQNMHEDFVQFLGRRAIARSSQLYYRANATDNISRLRIFFEGISDIPILDAGLYGAPIFN